MYYSFSNVDNSNRLLILCKPKYANNVVSYFNSAPQILPSEVLVTFSQILPKLKFLHNAIQFRVESPSEQYCASKY